MSFKYGDDGQGNIAFPAVTICLKAFRSLSQEKIIYKRCNGVNILREFANLLEACFPDETEAGYYYGNYGGSIFDEAPPTDPMFQNITELIQTAHMDVTEVVNFFTFGAEFIINGQPGVDADSYISELFTTIIHPIAGSCHVFDPALVNVSKMPMTQEDGVLTSLNIQLKVVFISCFRAQRSKVSSKLSILIIYEGQKCSQK